MRRKTRSSVRGDTVTPSTPSGDDVQDDALARKEDDAVLTKWMKTLLASVPHAPPSPLMPRAAPATVRGLAVVTPPASSPLKGLLACR
jgi:hypothetical protein